MSVRQILLKVAAMFVAIAAALPVSGQVVGYFPGFLPRYKEVATVPGIVLDANEGRILFRGNEGVVSLFDLSSRTSSVVLTNESGRVFLTDAGVFVLDNPMLQVDGGEQISLGALGVFSPDFREKTTEGRFAILPTTNGLVLRDFSARTNCMLSATPGFADVAANGAVAFTTAIDETNKAVRWFENGEIKTIAVSPLYEYPYVATDGTNVLWSEHHAPLGQQFPFGEVYLRTAAGEKIELSTNTSVFSYVSTRGEMPRLPVVAMRNGWVIFPRGSATQMTLWRRAPDGTMAQLTAGPAAVAAMGDDGSALISGEYLLYAPVTGAQKRIGGGFPMASYFVSGGKFYACGFSERHPGEGTTIFEIELEQDPFGILDPTYDGETQTFSFVMMPGLAGDYELQRTTDFVAWTTLKTISAAEGQPVSVEVTTGPGSFRLHKL